MQYSQNFVTLCQAPGNDSCHLIPYRDPRGLLTVGFGHRTTDDSPITQVFADALFLSDAEKAENIVNEYCFGGDWTIDLNQNEFDALTDMCFNMGTIPFMNHDGTKTHLYQCLLAGDYEGAANHILDFNHSDGVVLAGLTRRRQQEKDLFMTPIPAEGV